MHFANVLSFFGIGSLALASAIPAFRGHAPVTAPILTRDVHRINDDNHTQVFCRNETDAPILTYGDPDYGGPGVIIVNFDDRANGSFYFFYESNHDEVPYKYIIIQPWAHVFISVCRTFEGRIVRGDNSSLDGQPHLLGTWSEVNWHPDGSAWGDISLLEGNDGAAVIQSLDGINSMKGFAVDLITNAPPKAKAQKLTGSWCLDKITGIGQNNITKEWESKYLDPWNVYLDNDINPVITTVNGRFQVTFYAGVI